MPTSTNVLKANKASARQLLQCALDGGVTVNTNQRLRILLSLELEQVDKVAIWNMFEQNMHTLYSQSSFGWDPPSKEEELFNKKSRFILIDAADELVAFTMFRFEYEEKENILYCYDFQIQKSHQRMGLGKLLMQALETIGAAWGMKKVMLTVFKANENAAKFYQASGFTMDEACPGYVEEGDYPDTTEDVDYEILSKILPRKNSQN